MTASGKNQYGVGCYTAGIYTIPAAKEGKAFISWACEKLEDIGGTPGEVKQTAVDPEGQGGSVFPNVKDGRNPVKNCRWRMTLDAEPHERGLRGGSI